MGAAKRSTPIKSMTGFSRVSFGLVGLEVNVEVRAVNHRFLDINVKAPRCYAPFERDIRGVFQKIHKRGRIEVSLVRRLTEASDSLKTLPLSLDRYAKMYGEACKRYGVPADSIGNFLGELLIRECHRDEDLEVGEIELEKLLEAVEEASEGLSVMREGEGASLVEDVQARLVTLTSIAHSIKEVAAVSPSRLRERILERVQHIDPAIELDPQRLATEVVLMSDRIDTSEEISRFNIHLQSFSSALQGDPAGVGRKLDFLSQEIARELNTIGAKAQDATVQGLVVDAKTELERIREQVQNIE